MRQNDVDRIVLALVEEGQNNSEKYGFNLGKVMRFTPMQVGEIISNISIEPERKMGRWAEHYSHEDGERDGVECSECRTHYYFGGQLMNYCPNCGAYMGGEQDGKD